MKLFFYLLILLEDVFNPVSSALSYIMHSAILDMTIDKTAKNMKIFALSILEDVRNRDTEGLFILESGSCSIRNAHDNNLVYSVKPGDIFGEHALF